MLVSAPRRASLRTHDCTKTYTSLGGRYAVEPTQSSRAVYDFAVMNARASIDGRGGAPLVHASQALFAEAVLERLLGKVGAEYADGGDGTRTRRTLAWNCGCMATECDPPWFRLISCLQHRGTAA